jgi:hypothetical protein
MLNCSVHVSTANVSGPDLACGIVGGYCTTHALSDIDDDDAALCRFPDDADQLRVGRSVA